jgi:hypothetical protein
MIKKEQHITEIRDIIYLIDNKEYDQAILAIENLKLQERNKC